MIPMTLCAWRSRRPLELSPSRFEYDTSRLLKVLDATLAEMQSAQDDASARPAGQPAAQNTADDDVPAAAGTARGVLAEEDSTTPEPVARPLHESTPDHSKTPPSDEEKPRKNVSSSGRSRTLRRLVMIGAPLAALLAIYLIIQLVLDQPSQPENNAAPSSATNEFKEEAPWRLVIRNDGSSNGCTITLINSDTRETWSNPYAVYDTASFLIPQGGTFRWSIESGCTVVSRPGPGSLTLPAVVDGAGTSDASSRLP
jgi:hypothetical protein